MLHGQRNHHDRIFGALAFVNAGGVGQADLVELVEFVLDQPAVILAAELTTVTKSRWPLTFTRSTQKPVASL